MRWSSSVEATDTSTSRHFDKPPALRQPANDISTARQRRFDKPPASAASRCVEQRKCRKGRGQNKRRGQNKGKDIDKAGWFESTAAETNHPANWQGIRDSHTLTSFGTDASCHCAHPAGAQAL
ncbi:hypothetical protein HMPREF0972_00579 [Actinomyces sp. oral taxon 848 str. F0332]|nr:hypothetical protein HMPREF0972_00579 [Actinomyces sp. oral taxon 848 str. F0332]